MLRRIAPSFPLVSAISRGFTSRVSVTTSATTVFGNNNATAAQRFCSTSSANGASLETILSGTSAQWLEYMYEQWLQNPSSVAPEFGAFFKQVDSMQPITLTGSSSSGSSSSSASESSTCKSRQWLLAFQNSTNPLARTVLSMILDFETNGHTRANLDPLNYTKEPHRNPLSKRRPDLSCQGLGLTEKDLDTPVNVGFCDNLGGFLRSTTPTMKLRELHEKLTAVYTGNIGWEYMHINDFEVTQWLRNRIENSEKEAVDRKTILTDLADAVSFENFCVLKYGVTKRFGLEGGESLIPGLRALVNRSVDKHNARKFVLGMAHRGRLNVLVNCCGKPFRAVFKEFDSITRADLPDDGRQGDVKYHLGWLSEDLKSEGGKNYAMQLMFNPSHLEAVNPLVQGFTRCLQDTTSHDKPMASAIPIVLHGDAAFAGQGIVYEDMGVSELPKYTTGGTIHVVINNQVGYTTNPADSRSSLHASDIARCFECPIFHVNGDCAEDVVRVFQLAADYRARFNKSVCIDLVCYRRRGHNEGDEPAATQPGMYKLIRETPNVFDKYKAELLAQKLFTEEEADEILEQRMQTLKEEKELASTFDYKAFLMKPPKNWENHNPTSALEAVMNTDATKITAEQYNTIAKALLKFPDGFRAGAKMDDIYKKRAHGLAEGSVDYPTAEALAIGSLLQEGYSFRISGQDVQRGTFSHRHFVVHDEETGAQHCPLKEFEKTLYAPNTLPANRPLFSVTNSALAEYAVMGYDAGYSLVSPQRIAMWEAQFGDFYNGAQIIVDQFLVSGFTKWGLQYNTIISLPHGYDGQGPEHSSARMERFLQLVAEDECTPDFESEAAQHWSNNIEIIVPSTAQSYFHMLRRFATRNFRRPTFIFFSKSRLKECTTSLEDFTQGKFQPVIPDSTATVSDDKIEKIVLCQGQLYFDIINEAKKRNVTNAAFIRIEQLAPFPKKAVLEQISRYPVSCDLVWAQQEPVNMGAWTYLEPRLEHALKGSQRPEVRVAGRFYSSSPSTSSGTIHKLEQQEIMETIFSNVNATSK